MDLAACCERVGAAAAALPARQRVELRRLHRRARARRSRSISGQPLDEFLAERILGPLGMVETALLRAPRPTTAGSPRSTSPDPETGRATRSPMSATPPAGRPTACRAAAASSRRAADYHRFTRMLLRGGELDGVRLLGPRTLRLHGEQPAAGRRRPRGVRPPAVRRDDVRRRRLRPRLLGRRGPDRRPLPVPQRGEFALGRRRQHGVLGRPRRAASTVLFFTQLLPSSTYPIRSQLHQLVHQALVD